MRRFFLALTGIMLATSLLMLGSAPVTAATSGGCGLRNNCQTTTPIGASSDTGAEESRQGSAQGTPIAFTPGLATCSTTSGGKDGQGAEVPCADEDGGAWSNERQCYVELPQSQDSIESIVPESAKKEAGAAPGAYYHCTSVKVDEEGNVTPAGWGMFWSETPPAGVTRLSPAQAAYMLIQTFQLEGADIGLVPRTELGRRGAVGLPVWMWVENPSPSTWGPWTKTDTFGGVTVTATARATGVSWEMGDGNTVFCPGLGTAFVSGVSDANGAAISPDCGYRYEQMSPNQGRAPYTITARTQWVFEWEAEGQAGTDTTETLTTTTARIGELQSVNVTPNR